MPFSLRTSRGESAADSILRLRKSIKPEAADLLYAGQRQKARIIERTESGTDVDGNTFQPYSTRGPYYYYPSGHLGTSRGALKTRKAAVRRLLKVTGEVSTYRGEYLGGSSVGGVATRNGLGIRFESYADFKESLGRAGVDLTGPRAPHMLQAITVLNGVRDDELLIGVYGEAAARAQGNNDGTRYSPRRRWFGASTLDIREMVKDVYARVTARLKK